MRWKKCWAVLSIAAFPALGVAQTLITLTPANVIGGSGSHPSNAWDVGQFNATLVLDQQTGTVTEAGYTYWLGNDATTNQYFVIDLGVAYDIGQIELFNTHNWFSGDRATNAFTVSASNSVSGFSLNSPTQILSGNLAIGSDPITAATFTSANGLSTGSAFRYVQFTAVTYHGNSAGLNEIRLYAIPEPDAWTAVAGAVALAGSIAWRRRALARS